jgi:Rps23 Pro-64 3,4-dihydroxylase Tpa1-like proline 4-hydroxylase
MLTKPQPIPAFEIDPWVDAAQLRVIYQRTGRLHIPRFLTPSTAEALYRTLSQETAWSLVTHDGENVREALPAVRREFGDVLEREMRAAAYSSAPSRFQFLYECRRVSDDPAERASSASLLDRFIDFLNSEPFMRFARELTGVPAIEWADGQATRYRAGHFLTAHDDSTTHKKRHAAYVLNLTPDWKADWGGQLQFIAADGHVAEAYVPRFNALNIFTVPQLHCVSAVAPFAPTARHSVTGWLRSR